MKLPDKFYPSLTLLFLAIIVVCLLSSFVFQPQVATKATLSDILIKGPSINEETKHSPPLMKGLFAFLAAFIAVKGYEYWRGINHNSISGINKIPEDVSPEVTQYKETLNTISSLEVKSDPPQFVKRKKRILKNRKRSARFSSKQAKKIIASSRSLSEFMVAE